MNQYSSKRSRVLASEEKKIIKRIVLASTLTLVLLGAIIFGGIPAILSIGSFFNALKGKDATEGQDTIQPVLTPRLDALLSATNSASIAISGLAQAGTTVILYRDTDQIGQKTVETGGEFVFTQVNLIEGLNKFSAKAKTPTNQESQPSDVIAITYDKTAPIIDITAPTQDQQFSSTKEVKVTGKTEPQVSVTVDDQIAIIDNDGEFSVTIPLAQGEHVFQIVATDPAGNQTKIERKVNSNP